MNRTDVLDKLSRMDTLLLAIDAAMPEEPRSTTIRKVKPLVSQLTAEYEHLHTTLTRSLPLHPHNGAIKMTTQPQPQKEGARILAAAREKEEKERDALAKRIADTKRYYAEKKAKEQAIKEREQAAVLAAAQERKDAATKARALRAWSASGGSPESFDDAWPEIQRVLIVEKTVQKLNAPARARMTL